MKTGVDAERKQAYIDQVSFYGSNILEAVAAAAHNWCAEQLPVWLALFQGKDVEGLLTHASLTSFGDATMQPHKWDSTSTSANHLENASL